MPSLAMELRNWEGVPRNINLVSGSAMADANPCIVEAFAPGVEYQAAIQPTSVVMNALAAIARAHES